MTNIYEIKYCKEVIARFYANLRFTGFNKLTIDRINYINCLVELNRSYFMMDAIGYGGFITSTAKKLYTDNDIYKLENGDEKAYFFIKMLDPMFQYLEIYESFYSEDAIKDAAILNFGYYDKFIIFLEKLYNKRFKEFDSDELWMRNSIKRVYLKDNNK